MTGKADSVAHIVGCIVQRCRACEAGDEQYRQTHERNECDRDQVCIGFHCRLCSCSHFQFSLPSTPTVFVDTFARPVSWLMVLGWHRLPGVTQWHMMPANHIQSRGRLRLWAPIWVVPQRIPVSSPSACANMWGTLRIKLSEIRVSKSRNLRVTP